jgi:hypothetical protein
LIVLGLISRSSFFFFQSAKSAVRIVANIQLLIRLFKPILNPDSFLLSALLVS